MKLQKTKTNKTLAHDATAPPGERLLLYDSVLAALLAYKARHRAGFLLPEKPAPRFLARADYDALPELNYSGYIKGWIRVFSLYAKRTEDNESTRSKAMDEGIEAHIALLEPNRLISITPLRKATKKDDPADVDADGMVPAEGVTVDWHTKASAAIASGLYPVTPDRYEALKAWATAVRNTPLHNTDYAPCESVALLLDAGFVTIGDFVDASHCEATFTATLDGHPIRCQADMVLDLPSGVRFVADLKTGAGYKYDDKDERKNCRDFENNLYNSKNYGQFGLYQYCTEADYFLVITSHKNHPYPSKVFDIPQRSLDFGLKACREALSERSNAISSGKMKGAPSASVGLPEWVFGGSYETNETDDSEVNIEEIPEWKKISL